MAVANELLGGGPAGPVEASPARGESGASSGVLSLTADPNTRYNGMTWFRSDTLQLCVDVNGTVLEEAAPPPSLETNTFQRRA